MKKFYKAKNDIMFKAIFCKEENRDLLKRLLEETLNMEIEIIEVQVPELIKKNIYEKGKTLDVLVRSNGCMINIEVNSYADIELHRRNASYIFKKYSELTLIGESYDSMPKVIQINLTSESNTKLPLVSKYEMIDVENKLKYIDNLIIYEYNLPKIKEKCYNKSGEYSLVKMLDCDKEELNCIKGDDIMNKLKKEVEKLNNSEEFVKFMSDEDEARLLHNTLINKGYKQNAYDIAKKMLEKELSIDLISDVTGITIEEIEKISKK